MGLVILHKQWGITLGLDGFTRTTALGRPPEVATGIGAFAFSDHQPGDPSSPVAYDPCDQIHVVVNERLAPAGADGLVEEALTELSGRTGLQLVVDGPTDDLPGEERPSRKLTPQGWRWSPVLVAWSTPEDDPGLAGSVAGLGGSSSVLDEFRTAPLRDRDRVPGHARSRGDARPRGGSGSCACGDPARARARGRPGARRRPA
jgi:hypothetical protein